MDHFHETIADHKPIKSGIDIFCLEYAPSFKLGTTPKFKEEFKRRTYIFALEIIKFIDELPNDNIGKAISNQHRSKCVCHFDFLG